MPGNEVYKEFRKQKYMDKKKSFPSVFYALVILEYK